MNLFRALRSQRGSQIVEFALIAPIMVYLVFCIPVFAIFARNWMVVAGSARIAARAASCTGVTAGERTRVAKYYAALEMYFQDDAAGEAAAGFDPELDVAVSFDRGLVVVRVTYHQQTYLPFLHQILDPHARSREDRVPLTAVAKYFME